MRLFRAKGFALRVERRTVGAQQGLEISQPSFALGGRWRDNGEQSVRQAPGQHGDQHRRA
jgi:hypothetical protein